MWVGGRVRIVVIVFGNQSFRVYFKRIQFLIIRQYHLFVLYFWKINYRIKCAAVVMLLVNLLANRNQAVMKWTKLRGFLEIYGTALFFPQPFSYFAYFFRAFRCEIIKIAPLLSTFCAFFPEPEEVNGGRRFGPKYFPLYFLTCLSFHK